MWLKLLAIAALVGEAAGQDEQSPPIACDVGQAQVIHTTSLTLTPDNLTLGVSISLFNAGPSDLDIRWVPFVGMPCVQLADTKRIGSCLGVDGSSESLAVDPAQLTFTCNLGGSTLNGMSGCDFTTHSYLSEDGFVLYFGGDAPPLCSQCSFGSPEGWFGYIQNDVAWSRWDLDAVLSTTASNQLVALDEEGNPLEDLVSVITPVLLEGGDMAQTATVQAGAFVCNFPLDIAAPAPTPTPAPALPDIAGVIRPNHVNLTYSSVIDGDIAATGARFYITDSEGGSVPIPGVLASSTSAGVRVDFSTNADKIYVSVDYHAVEQFNNLACEDYWESQFVNTQCACGTWSVMLDHDPSMMSSFGNGTALGA
eukprot:scaffold4278_cov346-Prasinococcus_capsulatus_cf.AAC.5